jgi:ABC-type branched-subunit amino acid transport system ATPase component
VMDFGRKVIDGEPDEVMASRAVQSIYMGEEDHG